MRDLERMRSVALAAADAAGEVIRRSWRDSSAVTPEEKLPGEYVTRLDRAAERAALLVLGTLTPDISVLAEESGGERTERMWVVDPVDGTTNLLRGFPVVGVSVALLEEGAPAAGAVTAPLIGDAWSAARGMGAHDSRGRRLRVSERSPQRAVAGTGFPFREKDRYSGRYTPALGAALNAFEDLRRAGAASLDLAYVAAGTWDGFFELGLNVWDIAAGALFVTEAGGVVTDWDGDPRSVFASGDIIAGNPQWHAAMLSLIADSRRA